MKSLEREAEPVQARTTPAPVQAKTAPVPKTKGPLAVESFTAREIEVAEQLIHLCESSASSVPPQARSRRGPAGSGSSAHRVPASAILIGGCLDWEEDEEHEVAGAQRRVKRFRLITEIYAATEEIGGGTRRKHKE